MRFYTYHNLTVSDCTVSEISCPNARCPNEPLPFFRCCSFFLSSLFILQFFYFSSSISLISLINSFINLMSSSTMLLSSCEPPFVPQILFLLCSVFLLSGNLVIFLPFSNFPKNSLSASILSSSLLLFNVSIDPSFRALDLGIK